MTDIIEHNHSLTLSDMERGTFPLIQGCSACEAIHAAMTEPDGGLLDFDTTARATEIQAQAPASAVTARVDRIIAEIGEMMLKPETAQRIAAAAIAAGRLPPGVTEPEHTPLSDLPRTDEVLQEVKGERARQQSKWGEQNHDPVRWASILTEEVGEVAESVNDSYGVFVEEDRSTALERYRAELVQVAAVAVAAVECLDRGWEGR